MTLQRKHVVAAICLQLEDMVPADAVTVLIKELASMTFVKLLGFYDRVIEAVQQYHSDLERAKQPDYLAELLDELSAKSVDPTTPLIDWESLEGGHIVVLDRPDRVSREDRSQERFLRRLEADLVRQRAERTEQEEQVAFNIARGLREPRSLQPSAYAVYGH